MNHSDRRTGVEYGVRLPDGQVHQGGLVTGRADSEARLARYQDCQYPDAELVHRAVSYGPWEPADKTLPTNTPYNITVTVPRETGLLSCSDETAAVAMQSVIRDALRMAGYPDLVVAITERIQP